MANQGPFLMDENAYYGSICLDGKWRLFCEYDRYMWTLDFTNADPVYEPIPDKRKALVCVDRNNAEEYLKTLESELSPSQIKNAFDKVPLTFVIDFDQRLFVDGGGEEGDMYRMNMMVPEGWRSVILQESDALFRVPNHIRKLWIDKKHRSSGDPPIDEVVIYPYTLVGAVKFEARWRFFFEQRFIWKLDLVAFIGGNWPSEPGRMNLRTDLPQVNETNASDFIHMLFEYELEPSEIPNLVYYLTETERGLFRDRLESGNRSDALRMMIPELTFVVNFDDRVYVKKDLSLRHNPARHNIDPAEVHAPIHWTCHLDDPLNHIPEELAKMWTARYS